VVVAVGGGVAVFVGTALVAVSPARGTLVNVGDGCNVKVALGAMVGVAVSTDDGVSVGVTKGCMVWVGVG
jgi:hypothetical protein